MPGMNVDLTEEQDKKLRIWMVVKDFKSKEAAIASMVDDLPEPDEMLKKINYRPKL